MKTFNAGIRSHIICYFAILTALLKHEAFSFIDFQLNIVKHLMKFKSVHEISYEKEQNC